jgi:hypothetical protein
VNFYVECKRSDKTSFVNPTSFGCDSGQFGGGISSKDSQKTADIVGLQNGVAYDFLVRTDSGASGSYGASRRGVVPQASSYVPTPPTIASVISNTASATLTWSPPTSNGGSPITNYGLQIQQHGANGYGMSKLYLGDVASSGTVYLSFSTAGPVKISVVAINANGASEPSQAVEVWGASANKPPGQPADIKINNINSNQTKLSWSAPSNNGSAITKYEVRYSTKHDFADWTETSSTSTCVSDTPSPPTASCTTTALTIGTQYYFQVRASIAKGTSEWSTIHASVVGAPDRPVISTTTPSDAAVYVAWDAPNDNGAAITKYKLQYDTDPNFTNATTVDTGTTANHTFKPAVNGTIYYFRVQAVNSRGDSPWSDSVSAIPYAPPSKLSIKPNQGLIVGGDLTTISGDNLSGVTSVKIDGNECKSFTVVDVHTVNCLTPAGAVGPKDVAVTNPGGTATIVGGFTYGLPSISLDIDHDIDLEVDNPSAASTVSSSHTVNVKTDNPSGYQLSLSMSGSDQNLASSTATISPTNASSTATALPLGTWGHSVIDAKNHWTSVPASAQPKLIKKTTTSSINGMSGTGDNTPVFYGVNVGLAQRAGVYTGKVVYTVVAEY